MAFSNPIIDARDIDPNTEWPGVLRPDSITETEIADGSITTPKLAVGALDFFEANGVILTAAEINGTQITGSEIVGSDLATNVDTKQGVKINDDGIRIYNRFTKKVTFFADTMLEEVAVYGGFSLNSLIATRQLQIYDTGDKWAILPDSTTRYVYMNRLEVDGILKAPQLPYSTKITITPTAPNTPTTVSVTWPTGRFVSAPTAVQATAETSFPGTVVTGVGVTDVTATGCKVTLTRTSATATGVFITAHRN